MIIGDRVTLTGGTALFGRTGRVERHEGANIWLVELDPSTDPIPGDYYPRGGYVSVYGGALSVMGKGA